jgi:hypothetical protein
VSADILRCQLISSEEETLVSLWSFDVGCSDSVFLSEERAQDIELDDPREVTRHRLSHCFLHDEDVACLHYDVLPGIVECEVEIDDDRYLAIVFGTPQDCHAAR